MMNYVEILNVSKTIRKNTVLKNITCSMDRGQIIGLRGVNGSGKTMLMRLLSGLIRPTNGEIYIDGKKLGVDMEFPPSMGLLIENPSFLDQYDGFTNLKILATFEKNVSQEEIQLLLRHVRLSDSGKKKFRKYSLGMKQRLGIAGAIIGKPDMILLDEPTNALDTEGIEMLKKLVMQEKERGALVVLASHDASFLDSVADSILYLEGGNLVGCFENKKR